MNCCFDKHKRKISACTKYDYILSRVHNCRLWTLDFIWLMVVKCIAINIIFTSILDKYDQTITIALQTHLSVSDL